MKESTTEIDARPCQTQGTPGAGRFRRLEPLPSVREFPADLNDGQVGVHSDILGAGASPLTSTIPTFFSRHVIPACQWTLLTQAEPLSESLNKGTTLYGYRTT